jgi:hypothetical protein
MRRGPKTKRCCREAGFVQSFLQRERRPSRALFIQAARAGGRYARAPRLQDSFDASFQPRKSYLTIGIGRTGGKHRSVGIGQGLANDLAAAGYAFEIVHRNCKGDMTVTAVRSVGYAYSAHSGTLNAHSRSLNTHSRSLNTHSRSLNAHSRSLNTHSRSLNAHSRSLNTHSRSLNTHSGSLNTHSGSLNTHSRIVEYAFKVGDCAFKVGDCALGIDDRYDRSEQDAEQMEAGLRDARAPRCARLARCFVPAEDSSPRLAVSR